MLFLGPRSLREYGQGGDESNAEFLMRAATSGANAIARDGTQASIRVPKKISKCLKILRQARTDLRLPATKAVK
jgi:hypothetical protein